MARKGRGGFDQLSPEQRRECSRRAQQTLGVDGRRARALARVAKTTPEQRRTIALKRAAGITAERKTEIAMKAHATRIERYGVHGVKRVRSFEEHGEAIRKGWAAMTPEARAERVQKRVNSQHAVRTNLTPEALDERIAARGRKISEGILRAIGARRSTVPSLRFNLLKPDMQPNVRRANLTPEASAERGRRIADGRRKAKEARLLAAPRLLHFNLLAPRVP
jgi:hypothetical protein